MKPDFIIPFMKQRYLAAAFSISLLLASIVSLAVQGLNFGLDFTGGTLVELQFENPADMNEIRSTLEQAGYAGASVIKYGSDREILIRLQQTGVIEAADAQATTAANEEEKPDLGATVTQLLQAKTGDNAKLMRVEVVGPQVGDELRDNGGLGMLFALVVVMFYVAVRFQFKFSVAAVIALIHDVVIILGVFSIFRLNFDLTVLAAILAVIGYSLNDTIVVADRIRENFRLLRKTDPIEVIDISLTQTLGRTTITSGTTVLVVLALFFVGGEMIHNFSLALIVGITIGTYSSIYVAANIIVMMKITREDLMPPKVEVEGADQENLLP